MMLPLWFACTWISQADLEDQLLQVDDDEDGVTIGDGDCDDLDAQIYPGAEDSWYDGIDSDCAGNDDFDKDEDGDRPIDYSGGDCDDEDPSLNSFDLDEDEQSTCDGDCDDQDPFTFLGAAYEELTGDRWSFL